MKKWLLTLAVLVTLLLAGGASVSAAGYGPVVAESEIFSVTVSGVQNYDEINRVLVLINQERAKAGLNALKLDPNLTAYAMQRAAEISVFYGDDHSRPDTSGCFSVFQGVYATTPGYGENIARGQRDADDVMQAWMNSTGHRNNILTPRYNSVGLGCFHQPDGSKAWVQLFHSYNYTGYYAPYGKAQTQTMPIRIYRGYIGLSVTPDSNFQLFPNEKVSVYAYLNDVAGRPTQSRVPITSPISVSQILPSPCILQGNVFTAKNTTGSVSFQVGIKNDYYIHRVDGTFQVVNPPTVKATYDGFNTIRVTWSPSCDRGRLYCIDRSTGKSTLLCSTSNRTLYVMNSATYNQKYSFYICDESGKTVSNIVTVSTALPKPKKTSIKLEGRRYSSWPVLSWGYLENATRYEVYRATSKTGTYKKVGETNYALNFIDYSDLGGTTYFYKVRGVNKAGDKGPFSSPVLFKTKLAAPKPKATALSNGNIRISWSKINGADTYTVYRRTGTSGSYQLLTTVKGTTYTNASGKAGIKYYYKVVASHSTTKVKSVFSAATAATKRLAKPTLKVTLSSNKPYLSWKKVSGATKYVIYRATTKNGKYAKLTTVTGTKYRNATAKKGKTYYYKVYAVCSRSAGKSVASTVKSVKSK